MPYRHAVVIMFVCPSTWRQWQFPQAVPVDFIYFFGDISFGLPPSPHPSLPFPFLSFLESSSTPPLRHYVLTGQTCLPLPLLTSPPLVFFSGFFQASCHTTANSWNSCPPLASNKRLQEGDEAAENKGKKKSLTESLLIKKKSVILLHLPACQSANRVSPGKLLQVFPCVLSVARVQI